MGDEIDIFSDGTMDTQEENQHAHVFQKMPEESIYETNNYYE